MQTDFQQQQKIMWYSYRNAYKEMYSLRAYIKKEEPKLQNQLPRKTQAKTEKKIKDISNWKEILHSSVRTFNGWR